MNPLSSLSATTPPAASADRSARPATLAVRSGLCSDSHHGAVVPPLHLSSNFTFAGFGQPRAYDYTRSGNPTRDLLATALAEAEGGAGAVVTSTGMSAIHLVLQLLRPGDLVVQPTTAMAAPTGCSPPAPPAATSGCSSRISPTRSSATAPCGPGRG